MSAQGERRGGAAQLGGEAVSLSSAQQKALENLREFVYQVDPYQTVGELWIHQDKSDGTVTVAFERRPTMRFRIMPGGTIETTEAFGR